MQDFSIQPLVVMTVMEMDEGRRVSHHAAFALIITIGTLLHLILLRIMLKIGALQRCLELLQRRGE